MSKAVVPKPKPLRIFVVENHPDTLTYLVMYLEGLGHAVASASTVKEAVEGLGKADYDVLISDIGLPDGTGWDLLRQVRERSARPLFGIAMSGFGMNADHERSRQAGYRHHLLKPFAPDELDVALTEAARETSASPAAKKAAAPGKRRHAT